MSDKNWNLEDLLRVFPNMNNTGWLFYTKSGASANVLNYEAEEIHALFDAGVAGRYIAHGVTHSIEIESVLSGETVIGWHVSVSSFGSEGEVTLSLNQADTLSDLLKEGPGEIIYECEEHKKISGICIQCLL